MSKRTRKNRRPSLQTRIRGRQQASFVGREELINHFRRNLQLDLDDDQRKFIFNLWGQGGIGKTTLLRHFQGVFADYGGISGLVSEVETSVPELLAKFSAQFKVAGHELKAFDKKYAAYQKKLQEAENDSSLPTKAWGYGTKVLTHTGLTLTRGLVPGGGMAVDLLGQEAMEEQVGTWAKHVRKKFSNADDAQLIMEPEAVLTPVFFDDIDEICETHPVLLCFDTYEQTGLFLDNWLLKLLKGEYGDIPNELIMAISGRNRLDENTWQEFEPITDYLHIEAFSNQEATTFLKEQGIENQKVLDLILDLAQGLPLLLATLAKNAPRTLDEVRDATETAVERFLRWIDDPNKRNLAIQASLTRYFDKDIVAKLSQLNKFEWLTQMPFVYKNKEDYEGWSYHNTVRQQLIKSIQSKNNDFFIEKHREWEIYFKDLLDEQKDDPQNLRTIFFQYQRIYHQLCSSPQSFVIAVFDEFLFQLFTLNNYSIQYFLEIIVEAGLLTDNQDLIQLAQLLENLISHIGNGDHLQLLSTLASLAKFSDSQNRSVYLLNYFEGLANESLQNFESAIKKYNEVLKINPAFLQAISRKGAILVKQKRYFEAVSVYSQGIELNPSFHSFNAQRGHVYKLLNMDKEANLDFEIAYGGNQNRKESDNQSINSDEVLLTNSDTENNVISTSPNVKGASQVRVATKNLLATEIQTEEAEKLTSLVFKDDSREIILTSDFLKVELSPLLDSIIKLDIAIQQIRGYQTRTPFIKSISQNSPITATVQGLTGVVQVLYEWIVPWKRNHAAAMSQLTQKEKEVEIETKKAEILLLRAQAANERDREIPDAEAKKLLAEAENLAIENERSRLALHREKTQYILDLINQLNPDLTENERLDYVIKILPHFDMIVESPIQILEQKD